MNQKTQKEVQERLGQLLAQSALTPDLKKLLLDSLDKIPDYFVFDLIDALEKEKVELERIALDVKLFLDQQDEDWKKVEAEQEKALDKIVDEEARKTEDEIKLEETRKNLVS